MAKRCEALGSIEQRRARQECRGIPWPQLQWFSGLCGANNRAPQRGVTNATETNGGVLVEEVLYELVRQVLASCTRVFSLVRAHQPPRCLYLAALDIAHVHHRIANRRVGAGRPCINEQ